MKIARGYDFPYHAIKPIGKYFPPPRWSMWEKGTKHFFGIKLIEWLFTKELAPQLLQKAKRKNITAKKALHDNHWVDLIYPPETGEEIREYAELWDMTNFQDRHINVEDEIISQWTSDGEYITKRAYKMQFISHKKTSIFHGSSSKKRS